MIRSRFEDFALWAESRGRTYWQDAAPIGCATNEATGARLDLLYRGDAFQIERVTHGAFETVPMHRHPAVDSFEFPLWGSGELWLNNRKFLLDDKVTPWRGLWVARRSWHGGRASERGGAFLSVQCWYGPILGSVIFSWESKNAR